MDWRMIGASVLVAGALGATMAEAAAETRVDAKADWSVFKADNAKECWIVSAPTGWKAERGGRDVTSSVSRGDILLMVSVRPGDNVKNEVSFTAGYPLRKDSKVSVRIGSGSYELFTDGEWGWMSSPSEDDQVVGSMRRGAVAVLTGVSQRGTTTVDTFSLKGFTAALDAAQDLCR
ncbi:invasion associated locus B family protein [Oceanicella sp. SM1341]|uniref:invasion associated locus B family protein n=1 Tax=Oceanicella sp. SM1341 TaxID=1548889 RepID=UPI001E3F8AAB|nr:invasion associated locus B family protein [Oceanicella sp. SM1341]